MLTIINLNDHILTIHITDISPRLKPRNKGYGGYKDHTLTDKTNASTLYNGYVSNYKNTNKSLTGINKMARKYHKCNVTTGPSKENKIMRKHTMTNKSKVTQFCKM